ncbi:MAG: hypothetical protein IKI75_11530 [Lachnospiraceae bacterium]|nr:hypothetical protein [Lachnospiraceae bacterium]
MEQEEALLTEKPYRVRRRTVCYCLLFIVFVILQAVRGIDIEDTLYAVGNYEFFDSMEGSWKYATLLSNLLGRGIFLLTGGKLLWMNILSALIPAGVCIFILLAMKNRLQEELLTLCLLAALGLCWCPKLIIYQYSGWLVPDVAAVLLYHGMMRKDRRLLFGAGALLGFMFFARVSNAVHCALILYVIYDDLRWKRAKELPADLGICVGGYAAGLALALVPLLISGGIPALTGMADWIAGLLSGSGQGGYSLGEMLSNILDNYLMHVKWLLGVLAGTALGILMFSILPGKLEMLKRIVFCGGMALLVIWFIRSGLFDLRYYGYSSMVHVAVLFILLTAVADLYVLFYRKAHASECSLALLSLILILITPLGSNNHIYACINNMFVFLPFGLGALMGTLREEKRKEIWSYPVICMGSGLAALLLLQSMGFGLCYSFNDGEDGSPMDSMFTEGRLQGVFTTEKNHETVSALEKALEGKEGKLMVWGNAPGLHYISGMDPAVTNLWPDLDSYPAEELKASLEALEGPAVFVIKEDTEKTEEKAAFVFEYMEREGFEKNGMAAGYEIYEVKR